MMVTFVSQCEKKAHNKTRRVLDAFANRIGDNTWQTVITQEGLQAVKKLLRKTATKNTAVSCHWVRSRSRSELVWVVGNRSKFNAQGVVPVNLTSESKAFEESFNMSTEVIALLASIAGFFHDVGKATLLFQDKLDPGYRGKGYEPFRHEWVSLRIFQAFVDGKMDREWLQALENMDNRSEERVLNNLISLRDGIVTNIPNPFDNLEPIAKTVAWLIVSHHRLPQCPEKHDNPPPLDQIQVWINQCLEPSWNSPQCLNEGWEKETIENNWIFPGGTPFKSAIWQTQISIVASKVLNNSRIYLDNWFEQRFTLHLSRLALMFSDHFYSSQEKYKPKKITPEWQDRNYQAYANTDKYSETDRGQKLDEHNIAVGIHAAKIARKLPKLIRELPCLKINPLFSKLVEKKNKENFGWQDQAFNKAKQLREDSKKYGFFGINMASTGKGKTRANARIMYGLSDEEQCRFSVALGLRTLTLQTGDVLRDKLKLSYDELAVLIGSQAVKDLHRLGNEKHKSERQDEGSESAESLLKDEIQLHHKLPEYSGALSDYFEHDEKILKLIQAPVLVSTIDYLIPATDGLRGGRQIAPMLRLFTSDLVLDEPDDFGLEDLPALCRLVNWAGMLGSRVLLSTATIPPELTSALFDAYQQGRKHYTQVNGEQGESDVICCAWFDEYKYKKPTHTNISVLENFETIHEEFVNQRIDKLSEEKTHLRKAKIIPIDLKENSKASEAYALTMHKSIGQLHQHNFVEHSSKKMVSIGLIRMANIDPLVAVAKQLYSLPAPENTKVYYCVYHSQYPLALRSQIETNLDNALSRHDEDDWWQDSGIDSIIKDSDIQNHIFVVLATSVAEVGRDHDYDWAIVEPSSMRSIIQLAGRIQRHRKEEPTAENIHILDKNFKALRGVTPAYCRPGFESSKRQLANHHLTNLLDPCEYEHISAIPRIKKVSKVTLTKTSPPKFEKFNELEHIVQQLKLFGNSNEHNHAKQWWQEEVTWCGEIQRNLPFRQSEPMDDYNLNLSYHGKLIWQKKQPNEYPARFDTTQDIKTIKLRELTIAKGNAAWFDLSITESIEKLMEKLSITEEGEAYKKFSHIQLRSHKKDSDECWLFSEKLGVFKELKKDQSIDEE